MIFEKRKTEKEKNSRERAEIEKYCFFFGRRHFVSLSSEWYLGCVVCAIFFLCNANEKRAKRKISQRLIRHHCFYCKVALRFESEKKTFFLFFFKTDFGK